MNKYSKDESNNVVIVGNGAILSIQDIVKGLNAGEIAAHRSYNANQAINEINTMCWEHKILGAGDMKADDILTVVENYESKEI